MSDNHVYHGSVWNNQNAGVVVVNQDIPIDGPDGHLYDILNSDFYPHLSPVPGYTRPPMLRSGIKANNHYNTTSDFQSTPNFSPVGRMFLQTNDQYLAIPPQNIYSPQDGGSPFSESPITDGSLSPNTLADEAHYSSEISPISVGRSSFSFFHGTEEDEKYPSNSYSDYKRLDDITTEDKRALLTLLGFTDITHDPAGVAREFGKQLSLLSITHVDMNGIARQKGQYGKFKKEKVSSLAGQIASNGRRKANPTFFCELFTCRASFTRKNGLLNHYKAHLGIADKRCQYCSQAFTTSLGRHEKKCKQNPEVFQESPMNFIFSPSEVYQEQCPFFLT